MRRILIVGGALIVTTSAIAQNCQEVTDPTARLACFDKSQPKTILPKQDATIERAKTAVRSLLKDPSSARFIEAKRVQKGVCGQLNAKNGYGGYSGIMLFAFDSQEAKAYLVQLGSSDPSVLPAIDAHTKICGK